jgi:hypothetical protein
LVAEVVPVSAGPEGRGRATRRYALLLWIAYLVPPLAWFGQLNVNFMVVAYACSTGRIWLLHLLSAAAFVTAGIGAWCAWQGRRHYRGHRPGALFLSYMALVLAGIYMLSIVSNTLPNVLVEPCR